MVNSFEQIAVVIAFFDTKNGGDRFVVPDCVSVMRDHACALRKRERSHGKRRGDAERKCAAAQSRHTCQLVHQLPDHSIHLRQKRALRRGMFNMLSSPSLTNNGVHRPVWLISRKSESSFVNSCPRS